MKPRTLTKHEKSVITKLNNLAKKWPSTLSIFGAPHGLWVYDHNTMQVFASLNISADGGDPDIKKINGIDYLDL